METVNIKFLNNSSILGPFYLIQNIEQFKDYWNELKIPKFNMAYEILLKKSEDSYLHNKLDHCFDRHSITLCEQIMLQKQAKNLRKNLTLELLDKSINIYKERIIKYLRYGSLIIDKKGDYLLFRQNKMLITKELPDNNDNKLINLNKAQFYFSSKPSNILIIENDIELSIDLVSELGENLRRYPRECDIIYLFKHLNQEEQIGLLEKINSQYDIIMFETEFTNKEQIKGFIKLISLITKSISFFILSYKDVFEQIRLNTSKEQFERILQYHTITILNHLEEDNE